jgi:hypothetical protein
MIVNVLSATQAPLTHRFARMDLFPTPFAGWTTRSPPTACPSSPVLLAHSRLPSWPLHDLAPLNRAQSRPPASEDAP